MAVSTNSYFSNSLPSGELAVGAGINLFGQDASPKFAIGTRVQRQDGSVYRYVHFGAVTSRGQVVAPDLNESAQIYTANSVIATSSAFQMNDEQTGTYPNMIGSKYLVLQIGTKTADQYAGGYVTISSGTGLGYTYRIKGNQASNGTATTFELYDKVQVGLDATGDLAIAPSKYANVKPGLSVSTNLALAVGVAVAGASTAGYYGFVITKGVIGVPQSGTLTTGNLAILSNTDAGCVEAYGNGATTATGSGLVPYLDIPVIGKVVLAAATSGHAIINVELE